MSPDINPFELAVKLSALRREIAALRAASIKLISKNDRLEGERDAALQQGRCERCIECGGFVSDYVEEDTGRGRICRPCETVVSLRDQLSTAQAAEARLRGAGELTLMFHSGEPWDAERSSKWMSLLHTLIGTEIQRTRIFDYGATTKNLCDAVRAALASPPTAALPDGEELLDWLENTARGKRQDSRFLRSIFICVDPAGLIQLDIKLEKVVIAPSLREAIRAAITGATP